MPTPGPSPALPPLPGARFDDALLFTAALHREQRRKGSGVAYLSHLLAVAALVMEDGGDEDEAIAALLHDAIEDHAEHVDHAAIRARFGERVAAMVADCTDTPADYLGGEKPPWMPRKRAYIEHIRSGPPALRVALADKLHNARCILRDLRYADDSVWDRFSASREETLWYYRSLVDAFREAGTAGPMLDEFARVVDALHEPDPSP
jgi:(p)ppGpp synthase/HD superfamily hydrolase